MGLTPAALALALLGCIGWPAVAAADEQAQAPRVGAPRTPPPLESPDLDAPPPDDSRPLAAAPSVSREDAGAPVARPVYKRWWFWAIVLAAGVGVGVATVAATSKKPEPGCPTGATCM